MVVTIKDAIAVSKMNRRLGRTGEYVRGRGHKMINGKYSQEMSDIDRKKLSEYLKSQREK